MRRRLAALCLALALPSSVTAADIKLWPLFRYAYDEKTDVVRWSAFGPLIEFTRTPEARDLRIRPLLWLYQRRGAERDDRSEILYPLAASRWQDDYQSFRFLLFTYRTTPPRAPAREPGPAPPAEALPTPLAETPPGEWTSRFTLFPLVWYRRSPERGTQLSVLPFWLDLDDFAGWDHVRAVMFPAYLRLTEPGVERRFYPFPFVSTIGGAQGHGLRIFPFYGTKEITGREQSRYVLWPFHIRSERMVPGYGWEDQRVDFPVMSAIDGPTRTSRAYGVVAHTRTVDFQRGTEVVGAPWPLVLRARALGDTEYYTWRLPPFYGRSDRDGISSRFYAWPLYRRKSQDTDDFHYRRQDVMLFLWRRQTLASDVSGRRERLVTMFPAFRSEREDGRRFGQAPAFFDSLMPKNHGVLALWAPIYGLVRWDTEADGALDVNLGWGLAAREDGRWRGPWRFDFGDRTEAADGG